MTDTTPAGRTRPLAIVVLAAGKGTRMKSDVPKVIHRALGRTVLGWVLAHCEPLGAERTVIVLGHGADDIRATLTESTELVGATLGDDEIRTSSLPADVVVAIQQSQRGSGDAVAAALPALEGFTGDVLVVNGDGALFSTDTLATVARDHAAAGAGASCLAITSHDDLPYGRVIIEADGSVARIVEARDASPEELAVRELNAGVYCFDANVLRAAVPQLSTDNAQGELYITDLLSIAAGDGAHTLGVVTGDADELLGINTRADLAVVERILQRRINRGHMLAGVTFSLAHTTLVEPTVTIAPDAIIEPGCILRGSTTIGARALVGPYSVLEDTTVEEDASVVQSTTIDAHVGRGASVGPYGYLRPGADLGEGSKVGTFVELKKTMLGARSKVPHLSYIGDATIGPDSNIGAGNITANYRPELGRGKQPTTIGSGVRTGSDNIFVAPVTIGDGAFTGAGSTIVQDVPAGALAIARARQVNLQDYAQRVSTPHKEAETSGEHTDRNDPGADVVRNGLPDARG